MPAARCCASDNWWWVVGARSKIRIRVSPIFTRLIDDQPFDRDIHVLDNS